MLVVTGAAGFIGSALVSKLNQEGFKDLILVDDFSFDKKNNNLEGKVYSKRVERSEFLAWLTANYDLVQGIYHLGARTDTTEFDWNIFLELNLDYSKAIFESCVKYSIPLVYASSAATYGDGTNGYKDDHEIINSLKPLNPYGHSKNEFDKWLLNQKNFPPFWAGLKFFNVYGPNEYHKSRMASVVMHAFNQIQATDAMKLFRSHNENFKDGEQLRDFVYVKDVVEVCYFLMTNRKNSSIYNLGTGKARTFLDLVKATFKALGKKENISFIDTPKDIRDKYQYYTEADMTKLIESGYSKGFCDLEEGVNDYVQNYLMNGKYY